MTQEHYNANDLTEPFTLLRKSRVSDSAGGFTESEAQVGGTHFAKVRPLRGAERSLNQGLASVTELLFVAYAAIGVTTDDVILYNGTRYNVRGVLPPGRSPFQEITAESGVVS